MSYYRTKKRTLKTARGKWQFAYRDKIIRIISGLPVETLKSMEWYSSSPESK
jgi:hypothetical protein